ncbi:MAG: ribosome hibernation-promoting factor, HPF/YfiA family [Dehalococcoidia bacterium]
MDVEIHSRGLDLGSEARQHISQKVNQVTRHLPGITKASVEVTSQATRSALHRIAVQATLEVGGTILRAEQRAQNTSAAINLVAEALGRQVERYKSQAYRSQRSRQYVPLGTQQAEELALGEDIEVSESLPGGELVRLKRFQMKPMTVEEAAAQMQLLGHSFYMFLNQESNQHNLLYLREDGNYGLIQPVID